jgi:hypothetical protein
MSVIDEITQFDHPTQRTTWKPPRHSLDLETNFGLAHGTVLQISQVTLLYCCLLCTLYNPTISWHILLLLYSIITTLFPLL